LEASSIDRYYILIKSFCFNWYWNFIEFHCPSDVQEKYFKDCLNEQKALAITHGIVHEDFRGLRRFVACKISWVNLPAGRQADRKSLRDPTRHRTIKRYRQLKKFIQNINRTSLEAV
jgi:glycosyltransferase involved in cell wall biosynthesis